MLPLMPESSAGHSTVKGIPAQIGLWLPQSASSSVKLSLTCLQVTQESALFQANAGNAFANTFARFAASVLQVSSV